MIEQKRRALIHPDLEIEITRNKKGEEVFVGKSKKYEPYEASADTAIDCFFQFNIQLSEQKIIAALIK
jgi:hypothetical protein